MHERPATATSWSLPEVQKLNEEAGVECIVNDACVLGMKAVGKDGQEGPARNPRGGGRMSPTWPSTWQEGATEHMRTFPFRVEGRLARRCTRPSWWRRSSGDYKLNVRPTTEQVALSAP